MKNSLAAGICMLLILLLLAFVVNLCKVVDEQTKYSPCAARDYSGQFGPGYSRKEWSQCFSCLIATTDEQFAVCPPEYKQAYLKKKADEDMWQKEHGYHPQKIK